MGVLFSVVFQIEANCSLDLKDAARQFVHGDFESLSLEDNKVVYSSENGLDSLCCLVDAVS
jgi:hypothetical protein